MSFGFGIGDFLAVIELAKEIRKGFVEAPVQFKNISDESLSLVLQDVEIDISAKELSSQQQADLRKLSTSCHEVLVDISKTIEDYTELSSTKDGKRNMAKRAWKRLKWEPNDIQELRLRIGTNIALLTAFNGQIIKRGVEKLVQHQEEEARQEVLDWLSPSNYATQQSDYIARREEGTGQWFLDSPEFKNWISGSKQMLFCPGIPGGGKTILASVVIDELYDRFRSGGEAAIAYLYCNYNRHDDESAIALLSNLLKQLAQSQPSLPSSVQEMYDEHMAKRTRPSMGELSKTIIQMLSKTSEFPKVYIVIDSLDECRMYDGSRTKLLDAMFELQDACNINILATSRFIPGITERFEKRPTLEIRASTGDVKRYLRGNLAMLPAFVLRNPELQTEISTEIAMAVDGMFLLAQLYLNSLVGKKSPKAIRLALKGMSSSTKQYDSAYNDAMRRIQGQISDQTEMAMQVLAWITCAKRPLTTVELQTALAVEIDESDFDEDNLPDLIDMVSVCAGLVTIDEQSNVIRLVHYTTQEFFQRNQSTWFPKANYDIGSICVAYLSFDTFKTGSCQTEEDFVSRLADYPFGNYAATFWGNHILESVESEAGVEKAMSEDAIIALLLDTPKVNSCMQFMSSYENSLYDAPVIEFGDSLYPGNTSLLTTGLHLAAYFELRDVAQKLISLGSSVNCIDAVGKTPLSWAAEHNRLEAIKFLLANGADPNIKDRRGNMPIFLATKESHEQAVELLLEANSDLLSSNNNGLFPLHAAAKRGSEKVSRVLLKQGLNAHAKDESGHTPLFKAAQSDHLNLVQLFLDWDLEVNPQDIELNASLSVAAMYGNKEIVQFLLEKGADANNIEYSGMTPLMHAILRKTSAIQVLLSWGVELELKGEQGPTALHCAATSGEAEVIQLLVEAGADINTKDNDGQTPLYAAIDCNYPKSVLALLKSGGVKLENKDDQGRTALSYAVTCANPEVAQLLLDNGADISTQDDDGQTPLHTAARYGYLELVLTLLKCDGVQLETKDRWGLTALSYAAAYGSPEVIQLLLETGADIDTEDNDGRSVFSHAASENKFANLTVLFTSTSINNIHRPDKSGLTPLIYAAVHGDTEVIQLLLENGADINTMDNNGRSVFFHAALQNKFTNLTALFTSVNIKNIHQPDRYGRTPLHVATSSGHLQSVLTLLKSDGVDCEAQDEFGRTALSDATLRKRVDLTLELKAPFKKVRMDGVIFA
ncbi:uncharacterized protein N7479_004626 [Penicillium vulpinum]|uniref:uncharacterized protein n=1 Tax=Penicillium vulpinum TaxID=29845 RepID=UPI0025499F58|nr:uncharacterized protein N7479_004626 [Penicillium vulpinum]KAJ5964750.1 hypothetical protein N7479_004626 [Penicillium vulpinum]